jgi:multidrug resistance protein MdtO
MTIAATLIMIVCMTFRIPFAFQGAIYALLISRESPRATLQSAAIISIVTAIGAAYLLVSVQFVISSPEFHFLWVICSFFLAFYAISALTNYTAAVIFAIMVSVGIPLWDRHVPAEINVEDTLWLCLAVVVGVLITGAVELAFVRLRPGDEVVLRIPLQKNKFCGWRRLEHHYCGVPCGARTIRPNIPWRSVVLLSLWADSSTSQQL